MVDQLVGLILLGLGIKNPINGNVLGERTETRQEATSGAQSVKDPAKELREALKEAKKAEIGTLKNTRLQLKSDTRASGEAKRKEFEEKKKEIEGEIQAKRDEFKLKLEALKDEKKKEVVARVDSRMKEINAKRVERMTAHLAKMTEILGKVADRAAEAKANGKEMSAVDAAIESAKVAIDTAQNAVTEQGIKEYVASITTESTLRNDVGTAMKLLETDLKAVQELVIRARKSVTDAITTLGKALGGPKTSESSGTNSPAGASAQ